MKSKMIVIRVLIVCLIVFNLSAQTTFYKTYTGSLYDYAQGVVQLPDSSYAITGSSAGFSGSAQAFLMVVDSLGNYNWSRSYGGSNSDWGRRIFHEDGTGFWIAGFSNSFSDGDFDFSLLHTDELGELLWQRNYGTSDWERLWDAIRLDDGGFFLVGETEGVLSQHKDMFIVRTHSNGDTLFTKRIQTPGNDVAYAVHEWDNETVLIGGVLNDTAYVVSMDYNGDINWEWKFFTEGPAVVRAMDVFDQKIFLGGSVVRDDNDYTSGFLLRINEAGTIESSYLTSYSADDYVSNILVLASDRVYWTSWSESPDQNVFPGGPDALVIRFHQNLYYLGFSGSFSGVDPDEFHQVIPTHDGGFLMVGFASDDRQNSSPGADVMLVKIGPNDEKPGAVESGNNLVELKELVFETKSSRIYPNPTNGVLFLSDELINNDYEIFNLIGQKVKQGKISNEVNVYDLKSGVYMFVVHVDGVPIVQRFMKE